MNKCTLLWTTVLCLAFLDKAQSLNVSIFYEAMCGDSVRFIALQLQPQFAAFDKHISLDLVPYGKAVHSQVNGQWEFLCQHGPSECKGNKYQSCALSQSKDQQKNVNFVNCVMRLRNPSIYLHVEQCAKKFTYNLDQLKSCSNSSEGDELLVINGVKTNTLLPSISFVPTIIYNDTYDDIAQSQSLRDFVAVVCSKITGSKPDVCKNKILPPILGFY